LTKQNKCRNFVKHFRSGRHHIKIGRMSTLPKPEKKNKKRFDRLKKMSYLCKTFEMGNDSDTSLKKKVHKVLDKTKQMS